MITPTRFVYTLRNATSGQAGYAPLLPLTLEINGRSVSVSGLVDSGASVNVLPYSVGLALGLDWNMQPRMGALAGNLATTSTRGVALQATVDAFAPVRLLFAWVQTDQAPLILGQANFFSEFDVCFFRSQLVFEVTPQLCHARVTVEASSIKEFKPMENDLLPEYRFDYSKAKPNRFALQTQSVTVALDSDVAQVFTTAEKGLV